MCHAKQQCTFWPHFHLCAEAHLPLNARRLIVLDTETTGLDPQRDEIVEIGAYEMCLEGDRKEGEQGENGVGGCNGAGDGRDGVSRLRVHQFTGVCFNSYLRPVVPMNPEAEKVHGLSEEFLRAAPPARTVLERFLAFIGDVENTPIVAHNAKFDIGMLNAALEKTGLCTLPLKAVLSPPAPSPSTLAVVGATHFCTCNAFRALFPNNVASLDACCDLLDVCRGLRQKRGTHGALLDAFCAGFVLAAMENLFVNLPQQPYVWPPEYTPSPVSIRPCMAHTVTPNPASASWQGPIPNTAASSASAAAAVSGARPGTRWGPPVGPGGIAPPLWMGPPGPPLQSNLGPRQDNRNDRGDGGSPMSDVGPALFEPPVRKKPRPTPDPPVPSPQGPPLPPPAHSHPAPSDFQAAAAAPSSAVPPPPPSLPVSAPHLSVSTALEVRSLRQIPSDPFSQPPQGGGQSSSARQPCQAEGSEGGLQSTEAFRPPQRANGHPAQPNGHGVPPLARTNGDRTNGVPSSSSTGLHVPAEDVESAARDTRTGSSPEVIPAAAAPVHRQTGETGGDSEVDRQPPPFVPGPVPMAGVPYWDEEEDSQYIAVIPISASRGGENRLQHSEGLWENDDEDAD
uniref:Exonuclease domain-containing protein n=1 Tax=Chromera velia CCMP2878 TaxID=1169474 RepID=A0A0G4HDD2_9ALVE|eukprot:Cvel_26487.t1-p1 / transcript=Cvel_26487.t1 / gene=Cvel_26487 / organism=Chromera_velia_CCMP2878 / gene_product=DNA polymerase III subunit epsilon, putative / transcript_product=DNA polymerase III subunit epsilon, putative / location=Cvel_scaffold3156:17293-19158(-) / protein_length=622 / sequence_SO=supercontig / SO=protein_coding / is_pseudo=false